MSLEWRFRGLLQCSQKGVSLFTGVYVCMTCNIYVYSEAGKERCQSVDHILIQQVLTVTWCIIPADPSRAAGGSKVIVTMVLAQCHYCLVFCWLGVYLFPVFLQILPRRSATLK